VEPLQPSLDQLARAKGLRFGSTLGATRSPHRTSPFHDLAYRELLGRECSVLVLENETKWPQLCPDPSQPYRFGPADELFAWAKSNGMALRGHTLLWFDPQRLPSWVNAHDFGAAPTQEAERLLSHHVRTTCRHFGDDIESWDVVNEAVAPHSGELRQNVFTRHLGGIEQIALAFHLAREHAPRAQLVYNDFMDWEPNQAAHRSGVLRLLTELKRRGAPVQALGLQAHIGVWDAPAAGGRSDFTQRARDWRRFLDEVMALDLDILVTEFDVNDANLPADTALRDERVAETARAWLDVTLSAPRLRRLLCWGLADHHSWLQDATPRADGMTRRPLPYDDHLRAKPLRAAIADALRAMAAR
jgi:endo-1,4-beta-xylanase